ncbi:MAG: universal stress protein [Candidatus Brocadiaceae bacterium]|nr:universal stress protein [Candidatus Brocadiaceae bacterium]
MDGISIRRIVCAVDFSDSSDHAQRYAVGLAEVFDAELRILHVVEPPFLPTYSLAGVPNLALPIEEVEDAARKHLQQAVEACRAVHADTEGILRTGSPFVEIINCARETEADLIVVGTHGRTGLSHMLIGSVAEKVVRKAPCPVLSVKHPDHSFSPP